ncbi:putative steroid dehydrogenase [Aspergillus karnatakaensis]|uniref:putative steroid dehydrogenase n=1 Tax=Aspergillus karnatakaensis TaxID=1810916 RepID=UPI003CCCA200
MARSSNFDVEGQHVVIAGGSKGLGRELAIQLTSQGANITILARSAGPLEETRKTLLQHTVSPTQTISTHTLDLTSASQVQTYITSLPAAPSILFCLAGGTVSELGFFADISPEQIESCMRNNYLSAAFIAQALLKRWIKEPPATKDTKRHICFTASTAAFIALPGYVAYAPTKTATRALADTLRQEVLLYRETQDIRIHCSFPGTIYTESFYEEQQNKPALLKTLEGSEEDKGGLSASKVAELTIQGLKQGKFFITVDSDTELLMNNMRGPSPRDSPIRDWVLGFVGSLVWPWYRAKHDGITKRYGRENLGGKRD